MVGLFIYVFITWLIGWLVGLIVFRISVYVLFRREGGNMRSSLSNTTRNSHIRDFRHDGVKQGQDDEESTHRKPFNELKRLGIEGVDFLPLLLP